MTNTYPLALSIIIVNWNVRDLLRNCLQSIYDNHKDNLTIEVIVVDSDSHDASVEMIQKEFEQVVLLAQSANVGFTKGNNIGLEVARGKYILLLNPDTEIIGDSLQQMVRFLEAHTDVGIAGPHTLNTDGTYQSTRRRFPTIMTAFFESTWLQPFAPKAILEHFYVSEFADDATIEVDWVQGSALMARREVYEQIGGLDTGFVMFSEEMDWCKRAKDAGWKVFYLGDALITHHGGKSTEQVTANKHIYFQESKLRYFHKHHGWLVASLLRAFLLSTYAIQIGIEGIKSLLGSKRAMRQERIQAYWQVIRSGLKVS
ncbi:MAG: glycosyltransferase family 2 protein [Aggregatilineales bacterium]